MVLAERFLLEETIEERYTTRLNIYGTSNYAEKFTSTIAFWALFSIPYNSRWYAHLFEKMDLVKKMMELCCELREENWRSHLRFWQSSLRNLSPEAPQPHLWKTNPIWVELERSGAAEATKQVNKRFWLKDWWFPLGLMKQRSHLWWETMIVSSFTIFKKILHRRKKQAKLAVISTLIFFRT